MGTNLHVSVNIFGSAQAYFLVDALFICTIKLLLYDQLITSS